MTPDRRPAPAAFGPAAFDSRRVAPPVRLDLWERATARFLVPMRISAAGRSIVGVIAARSTGGVSVCRLSATPHTAVRGSTLAGGPGAGHYKVAVGLHGRSAVTQHGRRVALGPGDVTVYDTSEEYGVSSDVPFGLLVVLLPHDALDAGRDAVARVAATRLTGDELPAVRRQLVRAAPDGGAGVPTEQVLAAVARLVRAAEPVRLTGPRDAGALRARAKELIGERLADPELDPDRVAAVLGVSRRYLYALLDAEVGPVARYIRTLRLERARDLLTAPDARDRPVADVAVECGLPDPAHFSRLFRAAYGVPPAAYRRGAPPS
ncbi:helix-turn-helix domain-containing protein [Modestobacter sp. NPDC049651]|uniref:helix-turn-helix domain-containing protein n=1 Tax=unclassified Modestobacter TaxID=2643866 RepID=UPI0033C1C0BC